MKEKVIGILLGATIIFIVGGLLYLAIKYPRAYPGYEMQIPTYYSPYPIAKSSNCIQNPEWCYKMKIGERK
jgi:hypothetical protein